MRKNTVFISPLLDSTWEMQFSREDDDDRSL